MPATVCEVTLLRRLERRGLAVQRQVGIPIEFEGERFDDGLRADMIVRGKVIVELKSVETVNAAHKSNS
ncbi:MAG: GxxExxY protein [Spirochaetia bacterium]